MKPATLVKRFRIDKAGAIPGHPRLRASSRAQRHVIPADNKWFARLVVAAALVEAMERLDLHFPKIEGAALRELMKARKALLAEKPRGKG
jgi:hypothetical protein